MDYARLIRDAWLTTWQYRGLWAFGLLAGATAGSLSIGRLWWPDALGSLAFDALGLSTAVLVLILLGLLATSVVARGGITHATLALSRGQSADVRGALRAGARWFWRFLGLLVLLGLVAAVVLGIVILATLRLGALGAALDALVLSLGAVASIVLTYAERSIVSRDLGPRSALAAGWRLFRAHPGTSLLAWSLSVGLAFVAALAATLALGSLLVLFGGLGLATLAATVGLLVLLAAVANTFFWSYWTLAYVRLEG